MQLSSVGLMGRAKHPHQPNLSSKMTFNWCLYITYMCEHESSFHIKLFTRQMLFDIIC